MNWLKKYHVAIADIEGSTGFECLNVRQLPRNASQLRVLEALAQDRNWYERYTSDGLGSFDTLLGRIELSMP